MAFDFNNVKALQGKLRPILRLFASLWRTAPGMTVAVIASRFLRAIQPALLLYVGKLIVDEVVAQIASSTPGEQWWTWDDSSRAAYLITLIGLEFLLTVGVNLLGKLGTFLESRLSERHGNTVSATLIDHAARLDLNDIESPDFQDRMQRARAQTVMGNGLLSQVMGQAQDLLTLATLIAGIAFFAPFLILLLLFALIPAAVAENRFNGEAYNLDKEGTEKRRQLEYIRQIGASPKAAKEVKLFGLGPFLSNWFSETSETIERARAKLGLRRALWGSLFSAIGVLAYYLAYMLVVGRTVSGQIGLGEMTFLSASLLRLNGLFERMMLSFSQLALQSRYLRDLFTFLDIPITMKRPEQPKAIPFPLRQGIVFENVGFQYPGKPDWVFRNLSFQIPAGQTMALVGANGAGKTTIVKLLTRLYDPAEGRILFDGVDIRGCDPDEFRDGVGTLFQDFMQYNLTASENIGLGRVDRKHDIAGIKDAAQMSGAAGFIERLPETYQQMLGRAFFKGADLSGGEWQKIAMARAYFRDAHVVVLDEPTASLDAKAEADVFARLHGLTISKTVLLISHRFSTVRTADHIIVLEKGRILESGSHETLLTLNGTYAELFQLQAEGYR